jgi:hypothetical protein
MAFGAAPGQVSAGFLFLGGAHQMLHLAPVTAELARRGTLNVQALVADDSEAGALRTIFAGLGADVPIATLPLPAWAAAAGRAAHKWRALKVPRLIAAAGMLSRFDVLVAAERTSTLLKRLPGRSPFMIHIPHGAGDRAKGFERRIALFDHVIVAGRKDQARMIGEGVVRPERCSVSGYIKLDAVRAMAGPRTRRPRLFQNPRPVILYNPHFHPKLGSWRRFGRTLIEQVRAHDDYNLIVAPHVRLAEALNLAERGAIEQLAVHDRVLIDLGSARSNDMTYTLGADLYVGDVSSQVYEFLSEPRPCVFLNAGVRGWEEDPSFASWHFGAVVDDPADAYRAIVDAPLRHADFSVRQAEAVEAAFGSRDGLAIGRAADIVTRLAEEQRRVRASRVGAAESQAEPTLTAASR